MLSCESRTVVHSVVIILFFKTQSCAKWPLALQGGAMGRGCSWGEAPNVPGCRLGQQRPGLVLGSHGSRLRLLDCWWETGALRAGVGTKVLGWSCLFASCLKKGTPSPSSQLAHRVFSSGFSLNLLIRCFLLLVSQLYRKQKLRL